MDHTGRSMLCFNCLARSLYLRAATPTGSQEESSDVTLQPVGPLTRGQACRLLDTDARQPQWARPVQGAQRQPPSFPRGQPSRAGHSPHPSRTVVPTAAPRERENSGLGLALCVPRPEEIASASLHRVPGEERPRVVRAPEEEAGPAWSRLQWPRYASN